MYLVVALALTVRAVGALGSWHDAVELETRTMRPSTPWIAPRIQASFAHLRTRAAVDGLSVRDAESTPEQGSLIDTS
jgi:hypothetical protein